MGLRKTKQRLSRSLYYSALSLLLLILASLFNINFPGFWKKRELPTIKGSHPCEHSGKCVFPSSSFKKKPQDRTLWLKLIMVLILTKLVWPGNQSAKIGFGLDLQSPLDILMEVVVIGSYRKMTVPLTIK